MKRNSFVVLSLYVFFGILVACQTGGKPALIQSSQNNKLSPEGEKVQLVLAHPDQKKCSLVQELSIGPNLGRDQKKTYARNKAAKAGGNTVFLQDTNLLQTIAFVYKCNP